MTSATVRPARVEEWSQSRDLRLEMIADTPLAYMESIEDARTRVESEWRERAARSSGDQAVSMIAEDGSGRWVGGMVCFLDHDNPHKAWLVAVYVAPAFRGREHGVADALLDAIEDWARKRVERIHLHVADVNHRARGFYTRRGYLPNGVSEPNTHDPAISDLEMVKQLRSVAD